jgi:peptide/nickel transport system permease protein
MTVAGFIQRPRNLVASSMLAALIVGAAGADFLASSLPLAVRWHGRTYFAPCLLRPAALSTEDNLTLQASLGPGDWILLPPIPWGPEQPDTGTQPLAAPGRRHWLGLDSVGLDVASRLVHGTRVSLAVGVVAAGLSVLVGLLLGAWGGYFRGFADVFTSRLTEIALVFPVFFLVLAVLGVLEHTTVLAVMAVLGLTRWAEVQRLVRAEILRLREMEFVQASRALGATDLRILFRHVVPNALGPVYVAAVFGMAGAILTETSLSFLGFGQPPPGASWGAVLAQGYQHTADGAWWLTVFPGLAIFVTVASIQTLGEGLRDALDPKAVRQQLPV